VINRVKQYLRRAPPTEPPETYAVIELEHAAIPVYGWMAARVSAQLQRVWTPRWIAFRDIAGAPYLVRSRSIRAVMSSTPRTRALVRAFYRARDREREQDEDTP
jgi:hypothetical protein